MTVRLRLLGYFLLIASLILGYSFGRVDDSGLELATLGVALLGVVGSVGIIRRWEGLGTGVFCTGIICAGFGVLHQLPLWTMLSAVLLSLAFWDLEAFTLRLRHVEPHLATRRLEKAHLLRLSTALGLGLILGLAGQFLRVKLSLEWAIGLGILLIVLIRLGISTLRREEVSSKVLNLDASPENPLPDLYNNDDRQAG
jgi:hypothetical protein